MQNSLVKKNRILVFLALFIFGGTLSEISFYYSNVNDNSSFSLYAARKKKNNNSKKKKQTEQSKNDTTDKNDDWCYSSLR